MHLFTKKICIVIFISILTASISFAASSNSNKYPTQYRTITVGNLDIFYREAGPRNAPTIILLHGFPTSSHMFRNLMMSLSDRFHLIAPDYPGFGNSAKPGVDDFDYTFDRLAQVMEGFIDALGVEHHVG